MSVAGKWNVTMETPIGTQKFVWDLQSQAGAWSGTMAASTGTTALTNIVADGDRFSCESNVSSPMGSIHVAFSGEVTGNTVTGSCRTQFGNSAFTGTRG